MLGGYWWLHTRGDGTHWADVGVGQCIAAFDQPTWSLLSGGDGSATHKRMDCSNLAAAYVVAVRPNTPDVGGVSITCPDPGKDKVDYDRYEIRSTSGHGRILTQDTSYGYAPICLAPNLHVGSCYSENSDRGIAVDTETCNGLLSWVVTRKIAGVADIRRCSPATGLVLHQPMVTYCETTYNEPGNPLQHFDIGLPKPPPAG